MAEIPLGPNDELPQIRTYIQFVLGFPLARNISKAEVIDDLRSTSRELRNRIPCLNARLSLAEDDERKCNALKLVSDHNWEDDCVTVNDAVDILPEYEQIKAAKAPTSMLGSGVTGPIHQFPYRYEGATQNEALSIRANFVNGGLLLCFALLYNVGDGNSLGQVIEMFAALLRGDALDPDSIRNANLDRDAAIPSLRPGQPQQNHNYHIKSEGTGLGALDLSENSGKERAKYWTFFRFSKKHMAKLKGECSEFTEIDEKAAWVSTNDALSALIWRSVTQARKVHFAGHKTSTLLRAINGRDKFDPPIPSSFLGNVIVCAYSTFTLLQMCSMPLSTLARQIRTDTAAIDDHRCRSEATFVRSVRDKSTIEFGSNLGPLDFAISSFAGLPVCEMDFGPLLGRPDFVRRPPSAPTDCLAYIMPKNRDGSLDVIVALRNDDMRRMRRDPVWAYYSDYIG